MEDLARARSARSPPTPPARRRRRRSRPGRRRGSRRRSRTGSRPWTGPRPRASRRRVASRHSPPMNSCLGMASMTFFSCSLILIEPPSRSRLQRIARSPATATFALPTVLLPQGTGRCTRAKRTSTTLAAALALLAPAAAARSWTVKGHGFGHGVGLSQYGAYGYAKHGRDYEQIVATTTRTPSSGASGSVRVLLGSGQGAVGFTGAGRGSASGWTRAASTRSRSSPGASSCAARRGGTGRRLRRRGRGRQRVKIAGIGRYRGSIVARATGGDMLVINAVGSEGYVEGRGAERGAVLVAAAALGRRRWSPARTASRPSRAGPFDQYEDTRSQVYGGRGSETKATNSAVAATAKRGRHLQGRPGDHLLLLHLRGPDRELGVRLLRRQPGALPEVRRRPVRRRLAGPQLDRAPLRRRDGVEALGAVRGQAASGSTYCRPAARRGSSARGSSASRGSSAVTGDTLRARLGLRSTWARFRHR